ncbi:hypothetical protein [Mucilaginibacter panaciglaebae]|uniref:Uncharacterized protein n=1 Tax=Mucilaginibacter panaciglaebae TaxID=502331 RepID=A0ABP7WVG3_9SPHI
MGFCLDKRLQPVTEGIKLKDKYESMIIDPNDDIQVDIILQKLEHYIALIDRAL